MAHYLQLRWRYNMNSEEVLKKITILYVEDDASIRASFSKRLEMKTKTLYVAENGQEGYEMFCNHKPDIILTDIRMPVKDGLEMIKEIRSINHKVPIIITSAYQESEYFMDAISLGVNGFLLKPINKDKLHNLLYDLAKTVIYEKECEAQNQVLQNILNTNTNLLMITKDNKITYANKTFLTFFASDSLTQFQQYHTHILNTFVKSDNYLHKGMVQEGENFIDFALNLNDAQRVVSIMDYQNFTPKTFNLKLARIDEETDSYLWNFIDITDISLEKIQIKKDAYFDKLTDIYNRRKMEEIITYELVQQKRYDSPFSFIMVDIDHFKKFNDTFGHDIGDEVLIEFAKTVKENIRNSDTVARWGGEEFVVLLTNTTLDDAMNVAENLRKAVSLTTHKIAGSVTASFGVTEVIKDDSIELMFKRADKALYIAKENGRNRVESFNLSSCIA